MQPIVIIGSGLAGYNLARELRKLDKQTPLTIITADDGSFYSKPMLSNALAKGKSATDLATANAEKMAVDINAEILTNTRVEKIDIDSRTVVTEANETLAYDKLVLALGATPRAPKLKGDAVDSIVSVNDLADYAHFRKAIDGAQHVTIIGAGLIGCEFANDLCSADYRVSVVGPHATPLPTLLPAEAGSAVEAALAEQGVCWYLGSAAEHITREGDGFKLTLSNGEVVSTDVVLSAIGLQANIALAQATGIATHRGIVVDQNLQSNHSDIYALGDCAEVMGSLLSYVMPLMNGARALAKTLTGEVTSVRYPAMPVIVKTPAHPVVASPPAKEALGEWQVEVQVDGVKACFIGQGGELAGFALTGAAVTEKQALTKQLPPLM